MYKSIIKIVLLIFISAILSAKTFDNIDNAFSLNFPDTTELNTTYLDYHVSHQELLRSSRNDTLLSRYTIREQATEFNYVGKKFSIATSWSRNVYAISDLFETDYTTTKAIPVLHRFDLKAQTRIKNWLIQPGLSYAISDLQDTLFIKNFPSSDILALNSHLFDLLPETIGDTIPYRDRFSVIMLEFMAHDQRLFFYANFIHAASSLIESHKNTSTNDKLNGPRESICKLNYSSIKVNAGWQASKYSFLWGGINYNFTPLDWHHTIFPDEPVITEIIQLAGGITRSVNAQLGFRTMFEGLNLHTSVTSGYTTNSDTASTPVLGYVLRILPISHQANLVAFSSYLLTHFHVDYPLKAGNSTFLPRLDMVAARFWTGISLEALLEFGLEDIDFQERYIHAVYIASLGCKAKIALNRDLFLILEADQLLPYVKTILPEPPAPTPSDIKRYGGLSISAGVSMSW